MEETKLHKKFTIFLVENTKEVMKYYDKIMMLTKTISTSDLVCVINYGKSVKEAKIIKVSKDTKINLLCREEVSDNACLFDALAVLKQVVEDEYLSNTEFKDTDTKIEIVGIGTCRDTGSISSKEEGINCFKRVIEKSKVLSKYYVLTDEFVINAAEFGFRSIGAINRNY